MEFALLRHLHPVRWKLRLFIGMLCKDWAVQLFTTRSPSASILRTRKIDSLFVRTLHRYCRGHGLESCSSRTFFSVRLKFHSHLSCVNRNCHDQSFLRLSLSYCSSVTELKICVNTTHIQFWTQKDYSPSSPSARSWIHNFWRPLAWLHSQFPHMNYALSCPASSLQISFPCFVGLGCLWL